VPSEAGLHAGTITPALLRLCSLRHDLNFQKYDIDNNPVSGIVLIRGTMREEAFETERE
jgi:hypothetical protein